MKRWYWLMIVFLSAVSCKKKGGDTTQIPTATASVAILGNENKQVIQGFGCATAFNPPNTTALTSTEFDRLFGSSSGQIGLNILRIRAASDDAWRLTELNNARAAVQRGAIVLATPWSPPARMKTNGNIIGGKLLQDSANAYAKYLNDFALYMNANGAPLYGISVQNEPDWEASYEGCVWTAAEMRDFLKNQGALITAARLMAPELVNNNQTYLNTILSDPEAVKNLKLIGTHLYGGGLLANETAAALGKEVWMTEHLDTLTSFTANLNTAIEIHDCFTKANFSAYIWWYGKRFYGLLDQQGEITQRGYMVAQFSRFIRNGAIRLGTSANTRNDVLVSAYKNGTKKVIVLINWGSANITQTVSFQNLAAGSMQTYTTTATKNVVPGDLIPVNNGTLTCLIPTRSIVTLVEQ